MNPDKQSIEEAAAEWLVQLHDDAGDSEDVVRRFLQWLDASPGHLQVFAELSETFDRLGNVDPGHRIDTKAKSGAPKVVMLRPDRRPVGELAKLEGQDEQASASEELSVKPESAQAKSWCERFSRLAASLAGFDLKLLDEYAGHEREHERNKLIRIGASVLVPAMLSFFTAFLLLGPVIENFLIRAIVTTAAAIVVLLIDCAIVSPLPRRGRYGIILRVTMGLCMSMLLAEPVTLALYRDSINAHINVAKAGHVAQQAAYEYELSLRKREEDQARSRIAALYGQSEHDSQRKLALPRPQETPAQKLPLLEARRAELKLELAAAEAALEAALVQLSAELSGERSPGLRGMGAIYREMQEHVTSLRQRWGAISSRIGNLENEIAAARADGADARPSAGEPFQKSAIEDDVARGAIELAAIRALDDHVWESMADLGWVAADDPLSQARALHEVIGENPLLLVKPLALILLLFLVDLTPIIVKLTIRTEYEEYLKTSISARHRTMAALREKDRQSLIVLGSRRIRGLVEFGQTIHRALVLCSPEGPESTYARAILSRVERTIGDQAEDLIAKATDCETSRQERARLADSVSLFRSWIGLGSGRRHASCR